MISISNFFVKKWKLLTTGSVNRRIFGATLTVGVLTILVKVTSIFKELFIAWKFGTSDNLDAFLIAWEICAFFINVIDGAFNAAFIPIYVKVEEKEGNIKAQQLLSNATVWNLAILVLTSVFIVAAAPVYLPFVASGFNDQKIDLTFLIICIILPTVIIAGLVQMWSAVLNAKNRFILTALSPIVIHFITGIFLLGFESWGIFSLATGLVFGLFAQMMLLGIGVYRQNIPLNLKWYGYDSHFRQLRSQYTPMIAGSLLVCSAGPIDKIMAATMSPGSVSALNYGGRLIQSPISLMSLAVGTAIFPQFSKMVARQDWRQLRGTLKKFLLLIALVTVPLTAMIILFSDGIIHFFLQRGSFTESDTVLVSEIQKYYAIQIPFYLGNILLIRLISSMYKNHVLLWLSALSVSLNIIFNYVFLKIFGIKGIALSTSCVYIFSFLCVLIYVDRCVKRQSKISDFTRG